MPSNSRHQPTQSDRITLLADEVTRRARAVSDAAKSQLTAVREYIQQLSGGAAEIHAAVESTVPLSAAGRDLAEAWTETGRAARALRDAAATRIGSAIAELQREKASLDAWSTEEPLAVLLERIPALNSTLDIAGLGMDAPSFHPPEETESGTETPGDGGDTAFLEKVIRLASTGRPF